MSQPTDQASSQIDTAPLQLLTFSLGDERYATRINQVQEVLEYTEMTRVPRSPDFMKGVINLRGNVVPVVDLRLQFGMGPCEPTIDTCIIIIEANLGDEVTLLGALADSVQEVIELDASQTRPPPSMGGKVDTRFISAMGKVEDEFIVILNLDKVFSSTELVQLQEIVSPE